METIEVDFEVWKVLTARRSSKEVTENDVLRELLGLEAAALSTEDGPGWTWKGVNLPNGTELRAEFKGREYTAKITRNEWVQDGKAMSSPSQAAAYITDGGVNGWTFWEAKTPDRESWVALDVIRELATYQEQHKAQEPHKAASYEYWKGVMKQLNRLGESLTSYCDHSHINEAMKAAVKAGEGKRKNLNHAFWSIRDWHAFVETLNGRLAGKSDSETKAVKAILEDMKTDQLIAKMSERDLNRRWDTLLEN